MDTKREFSRSSPVAKVALVERAANAHALFQNNLEQWVLAVVRANYTMSDEALVKRVADSCKSTIASNINFHEYMAIFLTEEEPVTARQHRLMGLIYKAINSCSDEPFDQISCVAR